MPMATNNAMAAMAAQGMFFIIDMFPKTKSQTGR